MLSITEMCTGTDRATSFTAASVATLVKLLLSLHGRQRSSGGLCAVRGRAQEPDLPLGSQVWTPLGYLSTVTVVLPAEETVVTCGRCTSPVLRLQP